MTTQFIGSAHGVELGRRGPLQIGIAGSRLQIVPDEHVRYAPAVWQIAQRHACSALEIKRDGRLTWRLTAQDHSDARLQAFVNDLERWAEVGGLGGVPAGEYPLAHVTYGPWVYLVTERSPAIRTSLKRLGRWDREAQAWVIDYSHTDALADVLDRAVTAAIKTNTTTVALPVVDGVDVERRDGEIILRLQSVARWVYDRLRRVRSARYDRGERALRVHARYAKSLARALDEVREAQRADQIERDARAEAARNVELPATSGHVAVTPVDGRVRVFFEFDDQAVALIRQVPGARWDREARRWSVPDAARPELAAVLPQIDRAVTARAEARAQRRAAARDHAIAEARQQREADQAAGVLRTTVPAGSTQVGAIIWHNQAPYRVIDVEREQVVDEADDPRFYGDVMGREGEHVSNVRAEPLTGPERDRALADREDQNRRSKLRDAVRKLGGAAANASASDALPNDVVLSEDWWTPGGWSADCPVRLARGRRGGQRVVAVSVTTHDGGPVTVTSVLPLDPDRDSLLREAADVLGNGRC